MHTGDIVTIGCGRVNGNLAQTVTPLTQGSYRNNRSLTNDVRGRRKGPFSATIPSELTDVLEIV